MQKQKQASASTNYRFKQVGRSKDISSFCQFRNQFQVKHPIKQNYLNQNCIKQLKEVYHHGICGKNSTGQLVVVDKIGAIKISQVNKILDDDDIVSYFNQRLLHISEKVLGQKQQVLWIIDLHGKIMQLASKKILTLLGKIIKNLQTYFPNILYKMYLLNTPMLFDTVWSKFSDQISEQTQQKIIMLSDQFDLLYQDVDNSIVPEFLGGELPDEVFLRDCVDQQDDNKENEQFGEQNDKNNSDSEEEQEFDFASLKQALSSMKMGGLQSVNQTPLNTQADEN